MTIAELKRAFDSWHRKQKEQAQEKATFDYLLADTIGRSVARIYSSSAKLPEISEVYPTLFNSKEIEEKRAQKQAELSAIRFKQFADFHNKKMREGKRN